MTIYAGSTLIASSAGAIDSDDTSNFALFAFSAIDRAAAGTKSSGSWEIAELFTGTPNPEKMPLVGGPVYFSEAAPLGAGSPSDPASAFDSYEWSAAGALTLDSSAAPALSESQAEALIAPIEARADEKIAETEAVRAAAQQVVDDWEAVQAMNCSIVMRSSSACSGSNSKVRSRIWSISTSTWATSRTSR
jgi:hypothetical protein